MPLSQILLLAWVITVVMLVIGFIRNGKKQV